MTKVGEKVTMSGCMVYLHVAECKSLPEVCKMTGAIEQLSNLLDGD